jgi:hypothetical protein
MIRQWQDELENKFGLAFTIIDREHLMVLRRERGYGANPWAAGSRFLRASTRTSRTLAFAFSPRGFDGT